VLDNGCRSYGNADPIEWTFGWSAVPGAQAYHLYVVGPGTSLPSIDNSAIATSVFTDSRRAFILQTQGWTWRVRARIGETFGEWSATRSFNVEPEGTDCLPVISSISPATPTASPDEQTITVNGNYLSVLDPE